MIQQRPFRYLKAKLPVLLLGIILGSTFASCNRHVDKALKVPKQDTIIKGNFTVARDIKFDSLSMVSFLESKPLFTEFAEDFRKLYSLHHFSYIWYNKNGITEATSNLINHLQTQQGDGIIKDFPYKDEFLKMVNQLQNGEAQKPDAMFELMFTAQYFNYAKNVWGGAEVDRAADIGWYLPKKKLNYAELLQQELTGPKDEEKQPSVVPQYTALKKALNAYQQVEKEGVDVQVAYKRSISMLVAMDTSSALLPLRKRLAQLGDLKNASVSIAYDSVLQEAVLHFKQRHGMNPTIKITEGFIRQLNVPVHKRIEQIIVNLERMRWVPVNDHGGEFILVNIPEYALHYYIDNKPVWDCKVVVGKIMTKTVIFSGQMEYIVFSPYWYVPESIIKKEIKPGMARDANYLAKQRMEWNGGQVRQKPGIKNSLGLVKFIFPNANNIYLHDTPSKPLFNEDDRAFSHGCIRVAQPRELAIRILKQMPAWTPEKIDAAMHAGKEKTVVLTNKIPVYIGYFTAFVNSNGELNFREDVYKRDEALLKFLMEEKK